mmetsp:Transcript_19338/g.28825  ORF Transcript_19338/g.28825 Transcript_19338/m.28825 type:complete len:275 (+) Transcript_19338:2-826(+)
MFSKIQILFIFLSFLFIGIQSCQFQTKLIPVQNYTKNTRGDGQMLEHIHFIDSKKLPNGLVNYLFRGSTPVPNAIIFQQDALDNGLRDSALREGVGNLPERYYLVDINLQRLKENDHALDKRKTQIEFEFYRENPGLGKFVYWHTVGIDAVPSQQPDAFLHHLINHFREWDVDKLSERVPALHHMLESAAADLPLIIYLHCDCGCDRTAEVAGAYQMMYQSMSWQQANQIAIDITPMSGICCQNFYAFQWFCYYLNAEYGRKEECEVDFNCIPC